jgi:hypothetical protein
VATKKQESKYPADGAEKNNNYKNKSVRSAGNKMK